MIEIRKATPDDAQALLDIYAPYVTDTAITFEYDVPSVDEFRHRIETFSAHYPYLVAEEDGVPVGYSYAHQLRERAAYQWCVETTIYLDKNHRHEHIGTLLYQAWKMRLSSKASRICTQASQSPRMTASIFPRRARCSINILVSPR